MSKKVAPLRDFLRRESTSGLILLAAAALGLIAANSPVSDTYFDFLSDNQQSQEPFTATARYW